MSVRNIFADESHDIYTVRTHADGPDGELPLTAEMLINRPSGDLFGMTMNAGMGWSPDELDRDGFEGLGDGPMDNPYDDDRY